MLAADLNRAKPAVARAASRLGSVIRQALSTAGFIGVGMVIYRAVATAATFEEAMIRVRANARLLGKEGEATFRMLEKATRKLGATTRFTSVQAAEAMNQLVLGGLAAEDAIGALPTVLNLAASAGFDLGTAAKVVVDNMVKFGMKASETGRIADFLSSAQSRAQTTAMDLATAHSALGSSAASLGISFRDTTAILTGLAKAGVRGGEAGTALAIAFQRMIAQPKEASEVLEELGINIRDFATGPGGALDAIRLFRALADSMPIDPVKRSEQAFALFGARGRRIVGLLGLMQRGKFVENTAKGLEDDLGRAARVAAARMDTFIGTLLELKSAMSELAIAALTPVLKAMEPVIDGIKLLTLVIAKSMETLKKWDAAMGGMIGMTAKAIVAVLALSAAFKGLIVVIKLTVRVIQMALVKTVAGVVVVALGLALAWIIKLIGGLDQLMLWTRAVMIHWKDIWGAMPSFVAIAMRLVLDVFLNVMNVLPQLAGYSLRKVYDLFIWLAKGIVKIMWAAVKTIAKFVVMIPKMIYEAVRGRDPFAWIRDSMEKAVSDFQKGLRGELPDMSRIFVPSEKTKDLIERELRPVLDKIAATKAKLEAAEAEEVKPPTIEAPEILGEKMGRAAAKPLLEVGERFAFRELGRSVQDALLQRGKDDKDTKRNNLLEQGINKQDELIEAIKEQDKPARLT